ncbi:MAG: hypothetical protein IPJ59_35805 [Nannocystis sp.]|nr:hypothetical protein [Nannocystis sp.]
MDPGLQELIAEGDSEEEVPLLIRVRERDLVPRSIRIIADFSDIVTCRVRRGDILAIRAHPAVLSMKAPTIVASEAEIDDGDDLSPDGMQSDERRPSEVIATGRGIVVGVIDWGLPWGTIPQTSTRTDVVRTVLIPPASRAGTAGRGDPWAWLRRATSYSSTSRRSTWAFRNGSAIPWRCSRPSIS